MIQAKVNTVKKGRILLDRKVDVAGEGATDELEYEALVLASGTRLASPGTLPLNIKTEGIESLRSFQKRVEKAHSILILGGGAVGVRTSEHCWYGKRACTDSERPELATDLGVLYPDKEVTLLHSREHLMPRFHEGLSDLIKKRFSELGVKTMLGSRAVVPDGGWPTDGPVTVRTQDGRSVTVDLVVSRVAIVEVKRIDRERTSCKARDRRRTRACSPPWRRTPSPAAALSKSRTRSRSMALTMSKGVSGSLRSATLQIRVRPKQHGRPCQLPESSRETLSASSTGPTNHLTRTSALSRAPASTSRLASCGPIYELEEETAH